MKKDAFNRDVYEPGDSLDGVEERLGAGPYDVIVAHVAGANTWSAQIRGEKGSAVDAQGFSSQVAILLWLNALGWNDLILHTAGPEHAEIPVDDIEED